MQVINKKYLRLKKGHTANMASTRFICARVKNTSMVVALLYFKIIENTTIDDRSCGPAAVSDIDPCADHSSAA